jgi:hypothetical protein
MSGASHEPNAHGVLAANASDLAQTTLQFAPTSAANSTNHQLAHLASPTVAAATGTAGSTASSASLQSDFALSVRPLMTWHADGAATPLDSLVALPFSFPFGASVVARAVALARLRTPPRHQLTKLFFFFFFFFFLFSSLRQLAVFIP